MKIENQKDLKALIKLCQETGVEAIEVDGVKMNLGRPPVKTTSRQAKTTSSKDTTTYTPGGISEDTQIPVTGLTEEQLLFYSSQGIADSEHQ